MSIKQNTNIMKNTVSTVQSLDRTTISYLTMGHGPAVIVIPGALSLASDYTTFAEALSQRFTVHIIERRGRGLSGPQGHDYSIIKECEDVLAVQRETGASMLVGHSFGGLVALEVARNSQVFTAIAVYEPGVSIDGSVPANWIPRYEKKLAENKPLDAFVSFVLATGPESIRRTPTWWMKLMLPIFMKSHELKTILSLLPENLREHKEVIRLNNSYENYRQISARVLLMYGGKHDTLKMGANMQRLTSIMQHANTREFPALDHFGIDKTGPQEIASAVSEYFAKI